MVFHDIMPLPNTSPKRKRVVRSARNTAYRYSDAFRDAVSGQTTHLPFGFVLQANCNTVPSLHLSQLRDTSRRDPFGNEDVALSIKARVVRMHELTIGPLIWFLAKLLNLVQLRTTVA